MAEVSVLLTSDLIGGSLCQSDYKRQLVRKVLIVFMLLACLPSFWHPLWGQAQSVGGKSSRNKKGDASLGTDYATTRQTGTKGAPLVVDVIGRPKTEAEAPEDKRNEDSKAFIDTLTVGSAIAVAAFTGILVMIGYCGVRAANRTLVAIRKQGVLMKRQSLLMASQLREMEKARKQDATHLALTERPWLSLTTEPNGHITFDDRGMNIKLVVKLSNIGKSPAKIVAVIPGVVLFREGFNIHQHRERFIELCKRGAQPGPFSIVFPGENVGNPISLIVPRTELRTLTDAELMFPYLFVSVAYRSTIDDRDRPFSFYTYLLRKKVGDQTETAGLSINEDIPVGLVSIKPDSHLFGPIAE
jgi:hypothetical protein